MQTDTTKLCSFAAYIDLNTRCLNLAARVVKEKIADVTFKTFKCKC
jgi:hypothetical protein